MTGPSTRAVPVVSVKVCAASTEPEAESGATVTRTRARGSPAESATRKTMSVASGRPAGPVSVSPAVVRSEAARPDASGPDRWSEPHPAVTTSHDRAAQPPRRTPAEGNRLGKRTPLRHVQRNNEYDPASGAGKKVITRCHGCHQAEGEATGPAYAFPLRDTSNRTRGASDSSVVRCITWRGRDRATRHGDGHLAHGAGAFYPSIRIDK
jgi:hypothetical protein